MVISYKNKYIFIASPKTGSRSVRKFLLEKDESAINYSDLYAIKKVDIRGHATAKEIKKALGEETYNDFKSISIIRHPYSKLVSSYFFYQNGYALTKGNTEPLPTLMRIWFAKLLPFKIWALLYPYKSNHEYLVDNKGNVIVDYIVRQEFLSEDISKVFEILKFEWAKEKLPHKNKSKYENSHEHYFKSKVFKKIINKKLSRDIEFYQKVSKSLSLNSI